MPKTDKMKRETKNKSQSQSHDLYLILELLFMVGNKNIAIRKRSFQMEFDGCLRLLFYSDVIMITFLKLISNENVTTNKWRRIDIANVATTTTTTTMTLKSKGHNINTCFAEKKKLV